jgi:hypothetical protein
MDKKSLLEQYHSQIALLRKIINAWELIPGAPSDEFDTLANKLLNHLHRGADAMKIKAILQSDLPTVYGLYTNEIEEEAYAKEVMDCWIEVILS